MLKNFPKKKRAWRTVLFTAIGVGILLLLGLSGIVNFLTDIEWFKTIGYETVFWTTFRAKVLLWLIAFGTALVITLLSNFIGLGTAVRTSDLVAEGKKILFWSGLGFAVLAPLLFASFFQGQYWEEYLKAIHSSPTGMVDPIFGLDVGYFIFRRPIWMGAVSALMSYLALLTAALATIYLMTGLLPHNRAARIHIGTMVTAILGLAAYLHKFRAEGIVFSQRGRVFGAGYTDVQVVLPYYRILIGILVISAVLTLVFSIRKRFSYLALSGLGLYLITVVIGGVVAMGVQNFVVVPNEIAKESEYIAYNIDYTRKAFGLDSIVDQEFDAGYTLTRDMLERNAGTVNNIRINDPTAALNTYNQLQGIRRYYRFHDIDIDRYVLDGALTQVFISARELEKTQVPNTHVNMVYKFTHGMGVSMNAVNEVTEQGQPNFLIRNIPPVFHTDIDITQPRIYYGELTNDSVIVGATIKEFDYPSGEANVENLYDGTGGVSLRGINRLLFALREGNMRMLISGYVTGDSKIMIYRNIQRRVQRIAPFLTFDQDPYIVISEGRLKWIIDAYTMTDRYPYSEPIRYRGQLVNYIRNPIKVVIDAYDGTVDFYVVEPEEPFAKVYGSIYPDLLQPIDEMPEDLRSHVRYPDDLFAIQTLRYMKYHMSDITVFYNEEDLWQPATEKYMEDVQELQPYYVLMKLPGEEQEEFILMRPFTPFNKNNAIAWMAARNDGAHYGELVLYRFSKQELIYGPMQVENRIDQNPDISRELTLLDQRGSSVIRGNLLMIPIEDTILYVEPIYIQSDTQSALPEVKSIIVSYGEQIVMEDTLEKALERLFIGETQPTAPDGEERNLSELIRRAAELLDQTRESSGEGNWVEFGRNLQELEEIIRALENQMD